MRYHDVGQGHICFECGNWRIMNAGKATDLTSRIVAGDGQAFEQLVHEHAGWMLALAHRFTNCEMEAADCVQESFLTVLKNAESFQGRSTLKTWLHRIVVNQALMKIRKKTNLREESFDEYSPRYDRNGFLIGPVRISDETVEALVSKKEIAEKVQNAIRQLPDMHRVILLLRDIEGFSTAETAEALEITDAAVRTRLHRARTALKKILEPVLGATYLDDVL